MIRDFIQKNYTPYTGDESFLRPRPRAPKKCSKSTRLSAAPSSKTAAF